MATSTMAADASAGASAAEIEAAFLAGAEDAFDPSSAHGFAGDGTAFDGAGSVSGDGGTFGDGFANGRGDAYSGRADGGAYPSDEAILGIEDGLCSPPRGVGAGNFRGDASSSPRASSGSAGEDRSGGADGRPKAPPLRNGAGYTGQISDDARGGEADSDDARGGVGGVADGADAPAMPEWLAQLGANAPSASAELGALWQRVTQLDAFDRAYYGDDAGAQQELVSALYAENPGALRAMFAAAANVLHGGAGNVAQAGAPGTERRAAPRDSAVLPERVAQRGAKGGRVAQGLGPAVFPRRDAGANLHNASANDAILSGARQNLAGSEESVDARRRVATQSDGLGSADANAAHRSFVARQNQRAPQDDNQIMGGAAGAEQIARHFPGAPAGNTGGSPQVTEANANAQREVRDAGLAANAAQRAAAGAQGGAQHANAAAHGGAQFDAGAYAQFERATNDAVVSDVTRAIERTLDHALPAGIADGARRQIAGDTLNEVHAALRGDRQLSAHVAEALRTGRFDDAAREQVSRLIASRARAVVPAAAKRVIGEWTGSVLATHRERAAKQQSTQSRVDITGGGLPQPVPRRTVRPSDVDYRATSDEEILSW